MRPLTALAGLLWASASVGEAVNASRKFYLHTQVKANQDGKERFDDLWLYAYHTGAGTNDAVLSKNKTHAIAGFLSDSDIATPDGDPLYGVKFDLDSSTGNITWGLEPEIAVNIYAAWQPVRIDVGVEPGEYSAFFVNETGLQWTTSTTGIPDSFGGWYGRFAFSLPSAFAVLP